jgi:hypothetical protein
VGCVPGCAYPGWLKQRAGLAGYSKQISVFRNFRTCSSGILPFFLITVTSIVHLGYNFPFGLICAFKISNIHPATEAIRGLVVLCWYLFLPYFQHLHLRKWHEFRAAMLVNFIGIFWMVIALTGLFT